jgi:hypothetical protein
MTTPCYLFEMLTQLTSVKSRLALAPADITHDDLLTCAIAAVSRRFDMECRREFARAIHTVHEFRANETEIVLPCYPLESVTQFELKTNEREGWTLKDPDYLIRHACVITLLDRIGTARQIARITYTGGYVLPGDPDPPAPLPGHLAPMRLPGDLEHAATEQVAAWFQNKDKLALIRHWPNAGTYDVLSQQPLLPTVTAILRRYELWKV